MLDFVEENRLVHNVDPVHYTIRLLVPPGSSLLGSSQMMPFLGALDEESFTYAWKHPDPRLDALQRDVSQLVEAAVEEGDDVVTTFYRIRDLALCAALGRRFSPVRTGMLEPGERPPGLTESWFC